jgi:hypothetical protein
VEQAARPTAAEIRETRKKVASFTSLPMIMRPLIIYISNLAILAANLTAKLLYE